MVYKLDPYKLAVQLLPHLLQSPLVLTMLKALCAYFRVLAGNLALFRSQMREEMGVLPSVLMLEALLNRAFFLNDNQIHVTSIDLTDDVYLYLYGARGYNLEDQVFFFKGEQQPPRYLKTDQEPQFNYDIIVSVPDFLATSSNAEEDAFDGKNLYVITQVMSKYRPAGKNYNIIIYNYE